MFLPAGTLVLLSLKYLTSLFRYIPKAALAALIIMAVAPLFDTRILGLLWRVKSVYLSGTCLSFSLILSFLDWGVRVLGSCGRMERRDSVHPPASAFPLRGVGGGRIVPQSCSLLHVTFLGPNSDISPWLSTAWESTAPC